MFGHKSRLIWVWVIIVGCLVLNLPVSAQEAEPDVPVVYAVLFYSPTCPHCHEAINNVMIPLMEEYGEELAVLGIDTSTEMGGMLFMNAITHYEIPENRRGVPTLVIEDTVLVSTMEIDNEFQTLLDEGLAAGGNSWPEFPGLAEIVADAVAASATSQEEAAPTDVPTTEPEVAVVEEVETAVPIAPPVVEKSTEVPQDTIVQPLDTIDTTSMADAEAVPPPDPIGFALGWLVLLGLVVVLVVCVWQLGGNWDAVTKADTPLDENRSRNIVMWVLIVIGLIVSGYLAYVETTQVKAVCGPVGECNIVQSSPYAQIAGVPIAVLGLLFYVTVIALWLLQRVESVRRWALLALVGLTIFGTLFSLYLTMVEVFVIGAICMWCLTSAVVTGLMCLLVTMGLAKRPLSPDPQLQAS